MRIAIINWSRRKVGGLETYIESLIPELLGHGHEVAFLSEIDLPVDRKRIPLPARVAQWCVAEMGLESALSKLLEWQPNVLYVQHIINPELETEIFKIAPAVYFMHGYFGTCISGTKSFKQPTVKPCDRRFGWQCLLHYYPHRCGGLNPLTMLTEYRRQSKRLERLHKYQLILANSDHMLEEITKHGLAAERIYCPMTDEVSDDAPRESNGWRLLFMGRMDFLKGGQTLIDALPQVCAALGQKVHVTFAGEGTERALWERVAARAGSRVNNLKIEFVGWVDDAERARLFAETDLLVVPSLWPEPFGLVGPEAGLRGIPAAAFAVGGIPEWLTDGVNGFLAAGDVPTSAGLADAIVKCLRDASVYERLRIGAREMAARFTKEQHLAALLKIFERVARRELAVNAD